LKRWQNKRVVVLGMARQGKALARYLTGEGAMVVMSDMKSGEQLKTALTELADLDLNYVLGEHPLEILKDTSALFLSGGVAIDVPIALEAQARGIPLLNDAQLFLEQCPAEVIGITGSAGKTTTTMLVDQMTRAAFAGTKRKVWLGGNIGRPLLADLDQIGVDDLVVMELSSFQLELMTRSPKIAALLNITPDHLDRHGSMKTYIEAKKRILTHQEDGDAAVMGYDDPQAWALHEFAKGRVIAFGLEIPGEGDASFVDDGELVLRVAGESQMICPVDGIALRGTHNVLNVLAACAISSAVGISVEAMATVASTFQGVPHRLEFIRTVLGADWYNDSIATTPDRAMAAIHSFDEPLVLLLGGRDKEVPWETFATEAISHSKAIILFGEAASKLEGIFKPLVEDLPIPEMHRVADLEQAIRTASKLVRTGDVVLLSPGCTSYDQFPNFEIRGESFRDMVRSM